MEVTTPIQLDTWDMVDMAVTVAECTVVMVALTEALTVAIYRTNKAHSDPFIIVFVMAQVTHTTAVVIHTNMEDTEEVGSIISKTM